MNLNLTQAAAAYALIVCILGVLLVAIGAYTEQKADYKRHRSDTVKREQRKADCYLIVGLILIAIGAYIL